MTIEPFAGDWSARLSWRFLHGSVGKAWNSLKISIARRVAVRFGSVVCLVLSCLCIGEHKYLGLVATLDWKYMSAIYTVFI